MDFGRLVTAMVTPFDPDLKVNWNQIGRLVDYLIEDQKSDSLVVCGTTGESPTLSEEEKLQMFQSVVRHAKGRCKVIAGTGSFDTAHTVHSTQLASQAGVDGILLVAPYYNRPSQEGLFQHFKSVANSTSLPIMLYNVPHRTGINIGFETTLRLAEIPNIVATKEAHPDLDHISSLVSNCPDDFKVYCGDDSLTLPMLSIGAYGIVSVASHIVGAKMKMMIQQYINGEGAAAAKSHLDLFPIFKGLFRAPSPAPVKHAVCLKGLDVGGVRLPLVDLTEDEGKQVQALLNG